MIRIPLDKKNRKKAGSGKGVGDIIGSILSNDEFRIYLVSDSVITGEIANIRIQLHGNVDLGGLKIRKIRNLDNNKALWILEKTSEPISLTPDALKVVLLLAHAEESGILLQDVYKYMLLLIAGGMLWKRG